MIHNIFGDLDDDEKEEEIIDLIAELTWLEQEEILQIDILDERIDANEMFYLHLNGILEKEIKEYYPIFRKVLGWMAMPKFILN